VWVGGRIVYVRGRGDGGGELVWSVTMRVLSISHLALEVVWWGTRFRLLPSTTVQSGGEARKSNYHKTNMLRMN
jgi:hypothetical protein